MKRLLIAIVMLSFVAGATFWFLSDYPKTVSAAPKPRKLTVLFNQTLPRAKQGDVKAQYDLGRMFETGKGVEKDLRKAFRWYLASAGKGSAKARYRLGWMYLHGTGVRKNYAKAAKWFRIASILNNQKESEFQLAEMYFYGRGVENDYGKAIQFYTRSAQNGYSVAQYILGSMYEDGWGVKPNVIVAYMWLKRASTKRDQVLAFNKRFDPVRRLKRLKTKMNRYQIKEAEKRLAAL